MKLKNPLLVVRDMERSKTFYREVLGLHVVMDFGANVTLTGGLCLQPLEHRWGQRVVRLYDPDRHIIEVGENMKSVCRRFRDQGMTPEQIAARMEVPLKFVTGCLR